MGSLCGDKYSIEHYIELDARQATETLSGTRLRQWRYSDRRVRVNYHSLSAAPDACTLVNRSFTFLRT
jgi:hypothetical protein